MKKKKLDKKLLLNKETISNLNPKEMDDARGGYNTQPCMGIITAIVSQVMSCYPSLCGGDC